MEKYINYTEAYLAMIQSTLNNTEAESALQVADEIYDAIAHIVDNHQVNIKEMLAASTAVHLSIVNVINEDLEEEKKRNAMDYE